MMPRALFSGVSILQDQPTVYLTFDDGPIPGVTEFVLDALKQFDAKATFFLVGRNVVDYPSIYARILTENHSIGNHTHHHLKGSKTNLDAYLADVDLAAQHIDSMLFRPPYGRITKSQAAALSDKSYQLVFWSLLSGDFDPALSPEDCLQNVLKKIRPNDIVVFHDSLKAAKNVQYVLPKVLEYCKKMNWQMKAL